MECLFCKIIANEISSNKIYEDELVCAFYDIKPEAPVHFLVIPKKHIKNMDEITKKDRLLLGNIIFTISKIASELGISENGYRVVNNCKEYGGQSVDHLHFHVLGGRHFSWPPG